MGAIKRTKVDFIVHNFSDFEKIYLRYFLKPGAQLFLDFGWDTAHLYDIKTLLDSGDVEDNLFVSDWEVDAPYTEGMNILDDLWFFGNSNIINKLKNLYDYIDDYYNELKTCSAHILLYHHIKKQNINFILYKNHKKDHNIVRRLNI